MNKRITLYLKKRFFFSGSPVSVYLKNAIFVNLRRIVVVGSAELTRGLLGRHTLLDALPLLGVQLFLIYPLHLKLRLQFL